MGKNQPQRGPADGRRELSYNPRFWFGSQPTPNHNSVEQKPTRKSGSNRVIFVLCLGAGALAIALAAGLILVGPHKVVAPTRPSVGAVALGMAVSRRVLPLERLDDLAGILREQGVSAAEAESAAREVRSYVVSGGTNRLELTLGNVAGASPHLIALELTRPNQSGLKLTMHGTKFQVSLLAAQTASTIRVVRGEMDGDSFYTSAVAAGIDDRLVPEIASAFAFDFDFAREIEKGDVFEIALRQSVNARGEALGRAQLVFVSLVTKARSRELYRFTPATGTDEWYDGNGRSVRRGLMRTPVEGARVSSYYGMRMHPVLGFMRMHKGIDFATPVGTPVFASGDGTVSWMGNKTGYGLYLRIEHNSKLATAYAHLSGFPPGIAVGLHVRQGDIVAFTGNSGELSTGPHLHYEVLVDGEQVDPLTLTLSQDIALTGPELAAFRASRDYIDVLRQNAL